MERTIDIEAFHCIFRDISHSVHMHSQARDIADRVIKRVTEVLRAKGALIRTLNPDTYELDLAVSYGLSHEYLSKGPVLWVKVIKNLHLQDEISIIKDILRDPRIQYPQMTWEEGVRMIVDAPLILKNQIIGIIRVYFAEQRELSAEEFNFLIFTSRQAACAIEMSGFIEKQRSNYEQLALQTEKMSALGRMAAGIAHEINNPLAGILLYSSNMIKKVPQEGPIKEGLEVIINETKRCKAIIQELLEFSRAGEPQKALASVNEIIEKALSILANEFRLRHIHIEKQISMDMENILLDEKQIQQVFVNILLNAIQAIEEKGVVTIRTFADRDQGLVRVEILDSGPGIPEEYLSKIFEPFFSTKGNGTGLGLAVSYGIIENHHGNILASSKPEGGTCITIELPLSLKSSHESIKGR